MNQQSQTTVPSIDQDGAKRECPTSAPRPRELTMSQCKAIEMLLAGAKLNDIAEQTGVCRTTLWRWRKRRPDFAAKLAQYREQIAARTRDRVFAMGDVAADAVKRALLARNPRVALALLGNLGCFSRDAQDSPQPHALFGIGGDESVRASLMQKMLEVSDCMTEEQRGRAPQLLAIALAMENAAARRVSSGPLLELAGLVAPSRLYGAIDPVPSDRA